MTPEEQRRNRNSAKGCLFLMGLFIVAGFIAAALMFGVGYLIRSFS